MGQDLAERWPEAAEVFAEVDAALGTSLSSICWNGPEEDLRLTENTQPALLAHSIAAWQVLARRGLEVAAVAGHSLGEYSAAVAAGAVGLADAARTVRRRGQLMQEAVPVGEGAMAAVLGLADDEITAACHEVSTASGEVVVAANFNAPGQVVIAGSAAGVEQAKQACLDRGARRAVPVAVSAPFHSPLMAPARAGLEPTLRELELADPAYPLYRNVDAAPVTSADELRAGLIRQVDAPVLWTATIERLCADGFDVFIEIGAGSVLSGLVRRINPKATRYTAGTSDMIESTLDALGLG
jgi:[acyl-carrier-protein] S-malonyltransferase